MALCLLSLQGAGLPLVGVIGSLILGEDRLDSSPMSQKNTKTAARARRRTPEWFFAFSAMTHSLSIFGSAFC